MIDMAIGRLTFPANSDPMVRDTGITIASIFHLLAVGLSEAAILERHPALERADLLAIHNFAAVLVAQPRSGLMSSGEMAGFFQRFREDIEQRLERVRKA